MSFWHGSIIDFSFSSFSTLFFSKTASTSIVGVNFGTYAPALQTIWEHFPLYYRDS